MALKFLVYWYGRRYFSFHKGEVDPFFSFSLSLSFSLSPYVYECVCVVTLWWNEAEKWMDFWYAQQQGQIAIFCCLEGDFMCHTSLLSLTAAPWWLCTTSRRLSDQRKEVFPGEQYLPEASNDCGAPCWNFLILNLRRWGLSRNGVCQEQKLVASSFKSASSDSSSHP